MIPRRDCRATRGKTASANRVERPLMRPPRGRAPGARKPEKIHDATGDDFEAFPDRIRARNVLQRCPTTVTACPSRGRVVVQPFPLALTGPYVRVYWVVGPVTVATEVPQ